MFSKASWAGLIALVVLTGCGITDPDVDDGNGLTYGSPPAPLPALETLPFDALGGAGRLVFVRLFPDSTPGGVYVIDAATQTSWGFTGELYETPAVSPDGQQIVFSTLARYSEARPDDYYDIFAVDAQGADLRRLSMNAGQDRSPSWTRDGSEIFYYVASGITTDLYRRPRDGDVALKQRVPLDLPCVDLDGPVSVSPSGQLAFSAIACLNTTSTVRGRGIFVTDADGSGVRREIGEEGSQSQMIARHHAPTWSPDGGEIAFLEVAWDTIRPTATRVRVMDGDGANVRTIAELPTDDPRPFGNFGGGNAYALAWSPDGSRIAFNHHLAPLVASIYVVRTDGTGLTRVTTAGATDRSLSWSQ